MSPTARWAALRAITASPRFTQTLTEVTIAVALTLHALRALIGWPGSLAVLAGLVALAALSLASQPERVEWQGVLPISLLALVGFMVVSAVWSQYASATVAGIAYTLAFAFLGLYVALVRDTIQIVRAVGTALRFVLGVSLALEVLSGVLIDTPLTFLSIAGNLAQGGPIQGLAGTRNYLAFLAALAALSFWIEYRTRSVPRGLSYASLALAGATILFARSPVSGLVLAAVIAAGLVLVLLRRLREPARGAVQSILLISAVVAAGLVWIFRQQVLALAGATADATIRTSVWADLEKFIGQYPAQGWGWLGAWNDERYPFIVVRDAVGRQPDSALNAYVDVTLQLGFIGLGLLVVAVGLAFVRAWLVATERRSTVHVWPALVLVLLATTGMTESYLLVEGGFMLFVVCALVAARERSWRGRLPKR
ncbi:O-antigen ligase family protein [Microcella alkalica]|uniref:O-antigen ligase family protein n=1 Tax=Microcella alkalica TaxID=355930 RepID=UPI00145D6767|nr:O-antigen ligase family protein [Microcella alkalica]